MSARVILIITCVLTALGHGARAGTYWARTAGGVGSEEAHCARVLPDGRILLLGAASSSATGRDLWLAEISRDGAITWERRLGGLGEETGNALVVLEDGGALVVGVTGSYGSGGDDLWVLRIGADGDVLWQKAYGGPGEDRGLDGAITSDGGFVVAGHTDSFGMGGGDAWLLRLDRSGKIMWQRSYGGTAADTAIAVLTADTDSVVFAGSTYSSSVGGSDGWIVKVDDSGDVIWQATVGGAQFDQLSDLVRAADGSYVATGLTYSFGSGSADAWVLRLSASGVVQEQRTVGGPRTDTAWAVAVAPDGGYLLAAETESFSAAGSDLWFLRLGADLRAVWQYRYGGGGTERLFSLEAFGDVSFLAAGSTSSFGAGGDDAWLLRIGPNGLIDESCTAFVRKTATSPKPSRATARDSLATARPGAGRIAKTRPEPVQTTGSSSTQCESRICTFDCSVRVQATGSTGTSIGFEASVTVSPPCERTGMSYGWAFGDGGTSTEANPAHLYEKKGTYAWSLTATHPSLGACTSTGTIRINAPGGEGPVIDSISPLVGNPGDLLTISGRGFGDSGTPGFVRFGSRKAIAMRSWSDTKIEVVVPAGVVRTCNVSVTVAGRRSNTYELVIRPVAGNLDPTTGPPAGGTRVTLVVPSGTSGSVTTVLFGNEAASALRFIAPDLVICDSPSGAGVVDVKLVGTITTSVIGQFTYGSQSH